MKKTALLLLAAIIMSGCAATTSPTLWSSDPAVRGKSFEIGFRDDGIIAWREVVKVEEAMQGEEAEK